jgi:coenzyme F420-reducing hydrogenase beta subunit
MRADGEGFLYPHKKDEKVCGSCVACACFYNDTLKVTPPKKVFACKSKNDAVRKSSSSGGVFSGLAEYVIAQGGVVFGAAFDENCILVHSFAEGDDYVKFRRSKYVESDLKNSYPAAKKFLDDGRKVLFSGTPCQIAGLLKFLRKGYENLLCVDFICHGVPSPFMLKLHLDEITKDAPGDAADIRFRTKDGVWKKCTTTTTTTTTTGFEIVTKRDSFMLGFLQNLYLRPSCHSCAANAFRSGADITIGDYWGAETRIRKFDDEKGISLVMVRTDAGQAAFSGIEKTMDVLPADLNHAIIFNPNINRATKPHPKREEFFKLLQEGTPFSQCVKKFTKTHIELIRELFSPSQIRYVQLVLFRLRNVRRKSKAGQ